jgi:hypothetical protein
MPRRRLTTLLALALILLGPAPALAWNGRGHKTVAYIAYSNLSTAPSNNVRKRVDDLLKLHPRYGNWTAGVPANRRGVVAFMRASLWPDDIKGAPGFQNCVKNPNVSSFSDNCENRVWHYYDLPFSLDGTPLMNQPAPHALTAIGDFMNTLRQTGGNPATLDPLKSYKLTWLIHIVGDIHQPLHTTQRFRAGDTNGDGGGNDYKIKPFEMEGLSFRPDNLHSFWDNLLGDEDSFDSIEALAKDDLMKKYRREPPRPGADPQRIMGWLIESHGLGRHFVHLIDLDRTGSDPPAVSAGYLFYSRHVARQRVTLAGYRLADLLNEHLR